MGKVFIIQDTAQACTSSALGCPGTFEQPPSPQAADHHTQGRARAWGRTHRQDRERVGEESSRVQLQPILWGLEGGKMFLCPSMLSAGLLIKGGLEWVLVEPG